MKTQPSYEDEAVTTLSNEFHGELVNAGHFYELIKTTTLTLELLDKYKKAIFYGKDVGLLNAEFANLSALPGLIGNENKQAEFFIHGIVGLATEVGELMEALLIAMEAVQAGDAVKLDPVNIKEEVGDVFWYLAVLAKAFGFTFEQAQKTNIAKLRARFPNKFNERDAVTRDLFAERKVLEDGGTSQAVKEQIDQRFKAAIEN